jgi:hypothetical protein
MDEEPDPAPGYREECCTLTDGTSQSPGVTGTLDQRTPDHPVDDVTACSLRIKQDRRDRHTGTYQGFERRGRRDSLGPDDVVVIAIDLRPLGRSTPSCVRNNTDKKHSLRHDSE